MPGVDTVRCFCRKCGGDRYVTVIGEHTDKWEQDDSPVYGQDKWRMVKCNGCAAISFVHEHYFSEDADDEGNIIVHSDVYPPASISNKGWPEFWWLGLNLDFFWIHDFYKEALTCFNLKMYASCVLVCRAILDGILNNKVGDIGTFYTKIQKYKEESGVDSGDCEVFINAYDVGSATVHRGHVPSSFVAQQIIHTVEYFIDREYVRPYIKKQMTTASAEIKKTTPARGKK